MTTPSSHPQHPRLHRFARPHRPGHRPDPRARGRPARRRHRLRHCRHHPRGRLRQRLWDHRHVQARGRHHPAPDNFGQLAERARRHPAQRHPRREDLRPAGVQHRRHRLHQRPGQLPRQARRARQPRRQREDQGHHLPLRRRARLPDTAGNTNFGTAANKLVTITTQTDANTVLLYNANADTTAAAYKQLPSTSVPGGIAFNTFQPVVWTLTTPIS